MRGTSSALQRLNLPSTGVEGNALARRYRKRIWRMIFFGNIVGALPSVLGTAGGTSTDPDPALAVHHAALNLLSQVAYILVFAVATAFFVRKLFGPITTWLSEVRAPTESEHLALGSMPRRTAVWSILVWAAIVAWSMPYSVFVVHYHVTVLLQFMQTVVQVVAGGATGTILCYLLVERGLRPLTGLAMRGSSSPRPSALGALPRLLMAFAAGVGAPIVALGVGLVGLGPRQRAAAEPAIWLGLAIVVVGGFIVAIVSARAVTDPIAAVRRGFSRLKEGDLDVDLDVDEPGEIGQLQVGFNEMVAGLRERERMREVFVRLVGKDVAEHALAQGSALDGEVREATAMFVDVVGSTALGQSSTDFGYWTKLNAFFDVVVRAVETAGGFVNKFEGDGALCVFGAPVTQEDHAARALGAARTLRCDLDVFMQTSGIQAAIGLSTGNVVAGYVGTADRHEFTVIGDAVNEAKRLTEEAKTTDAKILVSEATIRAAEGEVGKWREAGSTHLRGRSDPTVAFAPK